MRIIKALLCFSFVLSVFGQVLAQEKMEKRIHIGLFVPLFLDSAFDNTNNYTYGKLFPKQSITGLEFYLGVENALDSLAAQGTAITLHVYDVKSKTGNIQSVATTGIFDSLDLIMGPVTGVDFLQLTQIANDKNIPFVSALYPNDGGIRKTPNLIIVNAKLNTHIQAGFNYVMRNFVGNNIISLRRKIPADDRVADVMKSFNVTPSGQLLHIKTVLVDDLFSIDSLTTNLDSLRKNVLMVGSVDEAFGLSMVTMASLVSKNYPLIVVGMPTWGNIKELSKTEFYNFPIIYSTSFFNDLSNPWSANFDEHYRNKAFSKPTDMVYRGYELVWTFANLLKKYGKTELLKNLSDKSFKLMSDFDFKPINFSKFNTVPDYYENKKVYLLRRENGTINKIN
jgi:ABC-type branched-subunit amino acid transport system substrate-binding protein